MNTLDNYTSMVQPSMRHLLDVRDCNLSSPSGPNSSVNTSGDGTIFEDYNHTCGVFDFVIEAVMMGILCVFGFTGNTLSIICLSRDRSKTATPLLLMSLEVADTLFLLMILLLRVFSTIQQFTGTLNGFKDFFQYAGNSVYLAAQVACTGTIYFTILVTTNRYISVCRPYQASSLCSVHHAKRHIVLVAIFSVLFNMPRFFEFKHTYQMNCLTNRTDMISTPRPFAENKFYQILYANGLYFIVMFLVPLTSLFIMNVKLITALRQAKRKRAQLLKSDRDSHSRSEEDITLMLIVVVLIFVVCQTPGLVTQILVTYMDSDSRLCPNAYFFYERISDLLVVANSSLNFIVYCFCSRRFRQILFNLVCAKQVQSTRNGEVTKEETHCVTLNKRVDVKANDVNTQL